MSWDLIWSSLPRLLDGAWVTLGIVGLSTMLGLVLAICVALGLLARIRLLRWACDGYVLLFRGTPFLVQIFLIYYGAAQFEFVRESILWPVLRDAWACAILALTLNTAAYVAVIFKGAWQALPKGEVEAALVLGLSRWQRFRAVLCARVLPLALPAYGNEVILLLKASALVSAITVMDLTGVARDLVSETFAAVEIFTLAAVIYIVLVGGIGAIFRLIGTTLTPVPR